MKSVRYQKCSICGIRRLPKSNVFLSNFHLDPYRCRLCIKASGIEDFIHLPVEKLHELKYICGSHFSQECFNDKRNHLLKSAVTSLNLPNPPLPDHLFAEFSLYTESYYTKQNFNPGESETVGDKETIADIIEYVPIASTSKASFHETYKRKYSEPVIMPGDDVPDIYKSIASQQQNKIGASCLTRREKYLLEKLKKSKITLKKLEKNSLDLNKLDSNVLKAIVDNAVKNTQKTTSRKTLGFKEQNVRLGNIQAIS